MLHPPQWSSLMNQFGDNEPVWWLASRPVQEWWGGLRPALPSRLLLPEQLESWGVLVSTGNFWGVLVWVTSSWCIKYGAYLVRQQTWLLLLMSAAAQCLGRCGSLRAHQGLVTSCGATVSACSNNRALRWQLVSWFFQKEHKQLKATKLLKEALSFQSILKYSKLTWGQRQQLSVCRPQCWY